MHFSQYLYSGKGPFADCSSWYIKSRDDDALVFDYVLLGLGVILAGIVVISVAALTSKTESRDEGKTKGAVVFMVGPIPIIFGNDSRLVVVTVVLAIVLIVVALVAGLR